MRSKIVVAFFREDRVGPYLAALNGAGAAPGELLPVSPARAGETPASALLTEACGLMLTGGSDIQPCLYGEARVAGASVDEPQPGRDQFEWDLLAEAQATHIPVFGICRGHQMLHVYLGGSLYQDVALQVAGAAAHRFYSDEGWPVDHPAHQISVRPHDHPMTLALAEHAPVTVNSRHHQAIRALGHGMRVAAVGPDGVVEASFLESPTWWARSVQWHPENLASTEPHLGLFRDFIEAARSFGHRHGAAEVAPAAAD